MCLDPTSCCGVGEEEIQDQDVRVKTFPTNHEEWEGEGWGRLDLNYIQL